MFSKLAFRLFKVYLFKVNNKNTRIRYQICSKLTIKTPERHLWYCFHFSYEIVTIIIIIIVVLAFYVKLYKFQVTKQLYKTLCRKSSSYLLKECQEHVKSQRLIKSFVKYLRWSIIQK